MDSSWFKDSELQKFILHHSRLEPGDKLAGKVIEVKSDDRILIDFGRFRALAEAPFSLQSGDIIHVVVDSRHPKLKLRLEAAPTQPVVSSQVRETLRQIDTIPDQPWQNVVSILQQFLNSNDIASILFPDELGINQALQSPKSVAKLKMYPSLETGAQPEKLSLLVDISMLEKLRVDFLPVPREKKLNITYYVKSEKVRISLERYIPLLRKNLEKQFMYLVINVFQSEQSITRFESEELEKQTGSQQVLDLNA